MAKPLHKIIEESSQSPVELDKHIETLKFHQAAQRSREHLMDFIKFTMPDPEFPKDVDRSRYENARHHDAIVRAVEKVEEGEYQFLILTVPPRHGKLCAHSTPVLTPAGWRVHGDLRPGDYVFGPDGVPTRVVSISADDLADMEVETTSGEVVKCHANHEWTVLNARRNAKCRPPETKETRELAEGTWVGPKGTRGGRARWQLPDVDALAFPEQELALDPYVLGVWLGDGSCGKGHISMAADDLGVRDEIVRRTGWPTKEWTHPATGVVTFAFGDGTRGRLGPLTEPLSAMGILTEKRIPEPYLRSSYRQRMDLLAGLMDTDGHVEAKTGRCRIVTTVPGLCDDIVDLVTTLGFRPYVTSQEPALSSSGIQGRRKVFTVGFQPSVALPTILPRRRVQVFQKRRHVAIREVRKAVTPEPGRCIQVEREDGLYLVGRSLIPTHNSEIVSRRLPAWFLGKHPEQNVVVATYNDDFAKDFGADVRSIVTSPEFRLVFPEVRLKRGGSAKDRLQTTAGGMATFVGVGGSLTGRGAHCFPAGTKISTAEGPVAIEDLRDRYAHALCFDAMGKGRFYRPIKAFVEQPPQPVWTLRTEGGLELRATSDHKIWVRGRGMTPMADLRPGDGLITDTGAGTDVVAETTPGDVPVPVFDIEVDEHHTLFANGIGASNCLIIDDLIKSYEEARSQAFRDRAWDWFTKVAMSRRMGKKLVIITFTRWHTDDIIGRLTDPENEHYSREIAKKIKIIDIPAIAFEDDDPLGRAPGEALWPEWYGLDFLEEQRNLDPLGFEALYQQRPTVADGILFRRENVRYYGPDEPVQLPPIEDLRIYCASDHAVATDQRSDFTVLLKVGLDQQNNIYLLDCWWRKARTDVVVEAMLTMGGANPKPLIWWAEKGHISKSIGPFLRKRMSETQTYFNVSEVTPAGDKEQRAQSISARMAMGHVFFPKEKNWCERAINELLAFPNGLHDDFVDTFSYIGLGLRGMFPVKRTEQTAQPAKYGTFRWVKEAQKAEDRRISLLKAEDF